VRGWVILLGTFLVGIAVGVGVASRGPALISPYLPKSVSGAGKRIEGEVVRKQRDGNRLLVKVTTAQGPMLVTFTQKAADLDVLLDAGDVVTLATPGYATFVEDPVVEHVKTAARAPSPSPPPGAPPPAAR
jgi:hypothetical protein